MDIIKKEFELYEYIYQYLFKRHIRVIQNEVKFMFSLKLIDLLAVGDDETYYLIEIKKDSIQKDDYFNLENIINNNRGIKLKGMLFGKYNKMLNNEINNNSNIELITLGESFFIKNKKWINNTIRNNNFYWDANKKYIRYCFANFYNINIKEIEFDDNYLYIRFKESYYTYEYIGNSTGAEVKGKLIHIVYDDRIGKYMPKIINNNVNIEYLQGYLLKNKLSDINYANNNLKNKNIQCLDNICKSLKYLLKYITFENFIRCLNMKNELILWKDPINKVQIKIHFFDNYKLIMFNKEYLNMFNLEELSGVDDILSNELSYLEFTNVDIENILYKPDIQIEYGEPFIEIKLTIIITINNKLKKFERIYEMYNYYGINDPKFYMMLNYDIILKYEQELKKFLKCKKYFKIDNRHINFSANKIRKKILKNNRKKVISIKRKILDYIER